MPNKKRLCKYLDSWISTYPFLRRSERGKGYAHCTFCNSEINITGGGANDVFRHTLGKKHKEISERVQDYQVINKYAPAKYSLDKHASGKGIGTTCSSQAGEDNSNTASYPSATNYGNVGSASPVADVIIKTEIDNETWMATLQSGEDEHTESTSRGSQSAAITPSKTQKRPIETDSPVSSSQPTEKRLKPETSKELDGFSISQLLNKLRGVIEKKNDELKRHSAEVDMHAKRMEAMNDELKRHSAEVDMHVKRMEAMNSGENNIISAISQRMGV